MRDAGVPRRLIGYGVLLVGALAALLSVTTLWGLARQSPGSFDSLTRLKHFVVQDYVDMLVTTLPVWVCLLMAVAGLAVAGAALFLARHLLMADASPPRGRGGDGVHR